MMLKTPNIQLTLTIIAIVLFGIIVSCNKKATEKKVPTSTTTGTATTVTTPTTSGPSSICECSATWFPHAQTPAPAEGIGSPFDTTSTTNCMFHQWSWQKFLWLTKPTASGKPLFEETFNLVNAKMIPVHPIENVPLVLTDSTQAGSSEVLVTNASFGTDQKDHTVYYGIFINDILQQAADSLAPLMKINPTNKYTFPIGSVEIKSAWVKTSAIASADLSNYYTTEAYLTATQEKTRVALLGLHVVGIVINHPEFIWATFEHQDLAPLYNWTNTTSTADVPVVTQEEMLLLKAGDTASIQNIKMASGTTHSNVFTVFEHGVPRVIGNGFMSDTNQNEPQNYDNIVSINDCVHEQLTGGWNNYFYDGSIWLNMDGLTPDQQIDTILALGGNIGNVQTDSLVRGSLGVSNITMETFFQFQNNPTHFHSITASNIANCFSCHAAFSQQSTLQISHIFNGYLGTLNKEDKKAKLMRHKEFLDKFK